MAKKRKTPARPPRPRTRIVRPAKAPTTPPPAAPASAPRRVHVPPSARRGILWPAIPSEWVAALFTLQFQLDRSQWWSAGILRALQLRQLEILLVHAARTVPHYGERLRALAHMPPGSLTMAAFCAIPVLKRAEIQEAGTALVSSAVPADHGGTTDVQTSGSTGRPITVKTTTLTGLFVAVANLRYHLWHGRDFAATVASIERLDEKKLELAREGKAVPWVPGYSTGRMVFLDIRTPVTDQLRWLCGLDADYLLTYPTNLRELVRRSRETGMRPRRLRGVATQTELFDPAVRDEVRDAWGTEVTDCYSAAEVGIIAIQCPEHTHYHVQAENLLVEVLDDDDRPCGPGEVGRVVVTDLHNFATPLIRYEIGDYAVFGEACACGRGLPVLARVMGRKRNMAVLPSGEWMWPSFPGGEIFTAVAPVRQFQMIQHTVEEIEVSLVVDAPLSAEQEDRLRSDLNARMGTAFGLRFTYVDEIARSAGGKYEDFICKLEA